MRMAGYAAIFDAPDKGGDIVRKGAFARAAKAGLPLLLQHDTSRRIGFVESLAEDERGLRVIATLDGDEPAVRSNCPLSCLLTKPSGLSSAGIKEFGMTAKAGRARLQLAPTICRRGMCSRTLSD